ncbi:MAG: DNA-protecting protein DprA [Chloroflexi bacterium]|nr:DNA-protecting protein DprA [Chloroflexota bacterium]
MNENTRYWVGFNIVPGIGPVKVRALVEHFGSVKAAWHADSAALQGSGLDRRALENFLAARSSISLDEEMERIREQGVTIITWDDPDYPRLLREIYAPPPVLYVKGSLTPADEYAVAIVGTRRATHYGREVTSRLAGGLAANGVTVVSGLARGIDAIAHRAALDAGGRTIAILGCGIDIVYPPEHARLAQEIIANGALITDYPLGTKPDAGNFPARNRIISGLCLGTLVTEADEQSGALITARYALEQGREVFAVPGSILTRSSAGTNRLIQAGEAKLVHDVQDILEELNLTMIVEQTEVREIAPSSEKEARLLQHLSDEPVHIDDLGRVSGLPIVEVSSTLALMELKGLVRRVSGMNYVLARESRVDYVID